MFSEVTKDTVLEVGQELLLTCKTAERVRQCRWTWRGLAANIQTELTVKTFPAFGNESQDCSIRLSSVLIEQEGIWTCGARNFESNFTTARPTKLSVRYPRKGELRFKYCDYRVNKGLNLWQRKSVFGQIRACLMTCELLNTLMFC